MKKIILGAVVALASACGSHNQVAVSVFAGPSDSSAGDPVTLVFAASNGAQLSIDNGVGDVTGKTSVVVSPLATTTYTLVAQKGGAVDVKRVTINVGPARAAAFTVTLDAAATAGQQRTATIKAIDEAGAPRLHYTGSVQLSSDEAGAVQAAPIAFADGSGTATGKVTFKTAGVRLLVATDTAVTTARGSTSVPVAAAAASQFAISALASESRAGDSAPLTVSALDAYGNVATSYTGKVTITSTDAAGTLPAAYTFASTDKGVHGFNVTFARAGSSTLTVGDGTLPAKSAAVHVRNAVASQAALTNIPAQASSEDVITATATVKDRFGNVATDYAGTLTFSSSDSQFTPVPVVFATSDAGVKSFAISLLTAGTQSIVGLDSANSVQASASVNVKHSATLHYVLSALPATAVAGQALGMTVHVVDRKGNLADDYVGGVSFSSTDATDRLPGSAAFAGGEAAVSVAFTRSGPHTVTAIDNAERIASVTSSVVTVGADTAKAHYELTLPSDTMAGTAVNVAIVTRDEFENTITGYTGAVTFTSTDPAATLPALTFTGTENGSATVAATFATVQTTTLTATTGAVTGSASIHVHGLVYTNPGNGGVVQLQADASSTPQQVQLNLVTVKNVLSAFGAGMDLPADGTKVSLASPALANDAVVFNPGAQTLQADGGMTPADLPLAEGAALNQGVLYTGVSSKAIAGPAGGGTPPQNGFWPNQDAVNIPAGTTLYSIRLSVNPAATPGTVFDGAALGAKFRAAVRDQLGNDTVTQADFAIGKLEIQ